MPSCREVVHVIGYEYADFGHDDDYGQITERRSEPTAIYPAPHFIDLPRKTPATVGVHVVKSFALAWVDTGAAANRLRSAVEAILDDLGIPRKQSKSGGGFRWVSLTQRVKLYATTNPGMAGEILEALKEIGHAGSHEGEVPWKYLMDAYRIFEHALESLYGTNEQIVREARERISHFFGNESKLANEYTTAYLNATGEHGRERAW